ncbi:aldehyde dehydrogenase [Pseudomonas sp. JM0905a]|uniref:aldehyde dehydrogenase family protein n=1 Tax=Pseudomonas sp. JM0905a TaxID=2772484 RepID=UPI0016844DB5|nr:aldehyde dehydrogenase [Pseudomonas sp. JM0905a]
MRNLSSVAGSLSNSSILTNKLHVFGCWFDSEHQLSVLEPNSGREIARVSRSDGAWMEAAVAAALRASHDWRLIDAEERLLVLYQLASEMKTHLADLALIAEAELGGQPSGHRDQILDAIQHLDCLSRVTSPSSAASSAVSPSVVAIDSITPFSDLVQHLGASVLRGSPLIAVTSRVCSISVLAIARLSTSCGFSPGLFQVLPGDIEELCSQTASHQCIGSVIFTPPPDEGACPQ